MNKIAPNNFQKMKQTFELQSHLTPTVLSAIARKQTQVRCPAQVKKNIQTQRSKLEGLVKNTKESIYGINTGFGAMAETKVDSNHLKLLQKNLLRSHAVGVGSPLDAEIVRAMLALRAQSLSFGFSGIRAEVLDALLFFLEHDVIPYIPQQGSVGASGDLAPLAHLALPLIGEGQLWVNGKNTPAKTRLKQLGYNPLELEAKEGLALINGTQMVLAVGTLAYNEAMQLSEMADQIAALSIEASQASLVPFDARIANARPHPGHIKTSENIRKLLKGSPILASHIDCEKVQDPYSFRCIPQVHGAVKDMLEHVGRTLEIELNATTDNPLLFENEQGMLEALSGGNFHAEPIAMVLDAACMALAELGSISERRIEQMVNPHLSKRAAFLAANPGLESGYMMAQVTAAALVSENKVLSHPAVVDSIPTSASKEDHVSMGPISARKFKAVVKNVSYVLAIEAMVAAEALERLRPLRSTKQVEALYSRVRKVSKPLTQDRVLHQEIETLAAEFRQGNHQ